MRVIIEPNDKAGSVWAANYIVSRIKAKAAVNFGFHGLGGTPYGGIGCSYLSPYGNVGNGKVMFEVNIGFTIF